MTDTKKPKSLPIARFVFCAFLVFLFLYDPAESAQHLVRGLSLCFETLIPALFPFMVISEILVRADIASYASPIFGKPMRALFGVSGAGAAALLLGLICGFPVGGKTAAALYEKGDISKRDAERLMAFCNLPSAPFMIFAVGEKLFESRKLGIFLYLNTILVSLICGMLFNISGRKKGVFHYTTSPSDIQTAPPLINIFTDSVASAASSVINISAYVCFFTCAVGCLTALFSNAAPAFNAILFSFFELTSGSAACSTLEAKAVGIILAAAAAGWSGLSVFFQIFSLSRTKRGDISMKPYIAAKVLTALFCGISAAVAVGIRPALIPKTTPDADTMLNISILPAAFSSAVDLIFILSLLIYLCKQLDRRRKI